MIAHTRGIVLKCTKYSESSLVVQIFTEEFGNQSYLVKDARKAKAKISSNLFSHLSLLDLVVYHKEHGNLQLIKECKQIPNFKSIPFDIVKGSILLFINEVLLKCLKHQGADFELFEFIHNGIAYLDEIENGKENFHLIFLYKLSKYIGIYTEDFDKELKTNSYKYNKEIGIEEIIAKIDILEFQNLSVLKLRASQRKFILESILLHYKNHIENFGELNSISILEEILN